MNYRPSDSSGTDDDLPPTHQSRFQRGGRAAANRRPDVLGSASLSRAHNDMEFQIHLIEQEAYCSLLRAFRAQSDAITWEKESLITEIRKELRVSDEEHRELLARANTDDMIRQIREWRKSVINTAQPIHDPATSPTVSGSRKKHKMSQSMSSLSMAPPSPALHQSIQSFTSVNRRGNLLGPKTKKPKSSLHYPSAGISGKPQAANLGSGARANDPAESGERDPLIGRKVWTRWPEDNHFYEAVIMDYNPVEGRHALAYDINTPNESWEFVNLKEISPEDIQWEGEDPRVSRKGGQPGQGRGVKNSRPRGSPLTNVGRGMGTLKPQLKTHNRIGKKGLDDIEILHTDTLIKEAEKVFGSSTPDPVEAEKAKRVLRDHEQALVRAIAKLEEISDGEIDEGDDQFGQ